MIDKSIPIKMVARDRLTQVDGKFYFGDILYSGAAFTVDNDKNFSADIIDDGIIAGLYRPLSAPDDGDYPQIDMTEGLNFDMDRNYIFPHETMQPSNQPWIHGLGYYIFDDGSINEYYFNEPLSSSTMQWGENGQLRHCHYLKRGRSVNSYYWEVSFSWDQAWLLKSVNVSKITFNKNVFDEKLIYRTKFESDNHGNYKMLNYKKEFKEEYREDIKHISTLYDYIPDDFYDRVIFPDE